VEKTELNKSVGDTIQVICLTCKNRNRHKIMASLDKDGKASLDIDDWFLWKNKYQIIECQGCGTISFRIEESNSEDYDEFGPCVRELIYPKRTTETWNLKEFFNIPYNLGRIYNETVDC